MAAVVVDPGPLARLSLRDDAGGVAGARESLDVGGDDGTKPWQRSGSYDFDRRPRRYPYRSRDAFVTCPDRSALGIAPGVALDKTLLKSSLRAAAMKWHPDRHAGAAAKRDAEAAFKKCYDAYDALVERTSA